MRYPTASCCGRLCSNILTFAVTSTANGTVDVTGSSDDEHVRLTFAFAARPVLGAQAPIEPASETGRRLALAAQIMEAMGGTLARHDDGGRQTISLSRGRPCAQRRC